MTKADNTHTPIHRSVLSSTPPAANITVTPPATTDHEKADQDLVRLCAQHIANREALEACSLDTDESPHWPPFDTTGDAISAARPTDLAGLAAIARAAKREALLPNDQEDVRNGAALDWAWKLVNELIRLDGGVA